MTRALQSAGIAGGARVVALHGTPIGTGQVGTSVRFELTWDRPGPDLPATVVGKFPSTDERSRAAGAAGLYAREIGFYRELLPQLHVSTPQPIYAAYDPVTADCTLLMTDVREADAGDQLSGCGLELATAAVEEIAGLHAPTWGRAAQLSAYGWVRVPTAELAAMHRDRYVNGFDTFVETVGARFDADDIDLGRWIGERMSVLPALHTVEPCAVHNDFRLDNLLIPRRPGERLRVVDWQTVGIGFGPVDVAYFCGTGLVEDPAPDAERALVERYRRRLADLGVEIGADQVWHSYCLGAVAGYVMAVVAAQQVVRTDRGDRMFAVMAQRSASLMRRCGLLDLVP